MAKKLKKVETPIDQRETFVSLQKNFVEDSDLSVKEKLRILFELQEADVEIDKILQLRGELPEEVAALEKEIAGLEDKVASDKALIEKYNSTIASHKQNIIDLDEEIERYRNQLDNIANSREFDSINKEIENQGYLRRISEKNINETRLAIANTKADIEDTERMIEIRNEDLNAKKTELEGIVESTSAEEKRLMAKREACAAKIDARTMSAYERIRNSVHNRLAVVGVYNENACGGCFNTITPQRLLDIASNNKLVICEHCGRIIVNKNFDNE